MASKDRFYVISRSIFLATAAIQIFILSMVQVVPVDVGVGVIAKVIHPGVMFIQFSGCDAIAVAGMLAMPEKIRQFVWVSPALLYVTVFTIMLINNLR